MSLWRWAYRPWRSRSAAPSYASSGSSQFSGLHGTLHSGTSSAESRGFLRSDQDELVSGGMRPGAAALDILSSAQSYLCRVIWRLPLTT